MKPTIVLAMAVSAVLLGIIAHQLVAVAGDEPEIIENGDANGDGNRDLADAIYMLHWLFHGGEEPIAIDCNVDQSARIAELERQLATANAESEALQQQLDECEGLLEESQCPTRIRIRREISSLTAEERTLFIQTYLEAWNEQDSRLKTLADDFQRFFSRGLHNNGAFLPWHRGYLLKVENILQEYDPDVTIPYWNWSLHPQVSEAPFWGDGADQFSGNGGTDHCVVGGPFGSDSGFLQTNGRCLERLFGDGRAASQSAVNALFISFSQPGQYDNFRNRLEHGPGLHDAVHCLVGGTMCSARASNDPIFFLHHANIDRIWSQWQNLSEEHREAYSGDVPIDTPMPAIEMTPREVLDLNSLPGRNPSETIVVRYQ